MDTPPKRLVGLQYGPDDAAPKVVLKGSGVDADTLLEYARQHSDVPVVRSAELAERLYRTPIDAPIDRELFPVVAALLAHVLKADKLLKGERG